MYKLQHAYTPSLCIQIYHTYVISSGNLLGVTATCALELGVDIGSLDVTLHLGRLSISNIIWVFILAS